MDTSLHCRGESLLSGAGADRFQPHFGGEFQNDTFITDMSKLQVFARDVIRRLPDSDTVDYTKTFYDVSDNHLLFFDDTGSLSSTLSLVHPYDISRFVFLFSTEAKSAGEFSEAEVQSLLSPDSQVSGALQARDLNEPLVARSLANPEGTPLQVIVDSKDADLPPFIMTSNKFRPIWNLQRGVPKGTTLDLNDMTLWTGELFKETPDIGGDLVAIFAQEKHKRILVVCVSVKIGNPGSKIKGKANSLAHGK